MDSHHAKPLDDCDSCTQCSPARYIAKLVRVFWVQKTEHGASTFGVARARRGGRTCEPRSPLERTPTGLSRSGARSNGIEAGIAQKQEALNAMCVDLGTSGETRSATKLQCHQARALINSAVTLLRGQIFARTIWVAVQKCISLHTVI